MRRCWVKVEMIDGTGCVVVIDGGGVERVEVLGGAGCWCW